MSTKHLSPEAFSEAPELALVEALRGVLEVAAAAIRAANPELYVEELLEGRPLLPAQVWIAEALLRDAAALRCTLERYAHAVEARAFLEASRLGPDFPF